MHKYFHVMIMRRGFRTKHFRLDAIEVQQCPRNTGWPHRVSSDHISWQDRARSIQLWCQPPPKLTLLVNFIWTAHKVILLGLSASLPCLCRQHRGRECWWPAVRRPLSAGEDGNPQLVSRGGGVALWPLTFVVLLWTVASKEGKRALSFFFSEFASPCLHRRYLDSSKVPH